MTALEMYATVFPDDDSARSAAAGQLERRQSGIGAAKKAPQDAKAAMSPRDDELLKPGSLIPAAVHVAGRRRPFPDVEEEEGAGRPASDSHPLILCARASQPRLWLAGSRVVTVGSIFRDPVAAEVTAKADACQAIVQGSDGASASKDPETRRSGGSDDFPPLTGLSCYLFGPHLPARVWTYRLVTHQRFDNFIMLCIFLSCCSMVYEHPRMEPGARDTNILFWTDVALTSCFTMECLLKMFAFGVLPYLKSHSNKACRFPSPAIATAAAQLSSTRCCSVRRGFRLAMYAASRATNAPPPLAA